MMFQFSKHRFFAFSFITASAVALSACGLFGGSSTAPNPNSPPAGEKGVYFMEPADGATVTSPFKVKFGVKGMEIKPAGEQITGTGHHHLLINLDSKPAGEIIPFDEKHMHFGKGQTEAEVKLPPGNYKLTMQLADRLHGKKPLEEAAFLLPKLLSLCNQNAHTRALALRPQSPS
jgi:Domain of unknown function (DUF4399)